MNRLPSDQAARDRFTGEWSVNLAVVANAGSGKTTAISNRLAAMAIDPGGAEMLGRTAVVTYTKKAAAQIGQRARSALLRRMAEGGKADVESLSRLDRVFFGTIHSFCLLLARRHGSTMGIHLNPTLVADDEDAHWQEFLEQDPMAFTSLGAPQVDAFLRHAPLDQIFDLAKELDAATSRGLLKGRPDPVPPGPSPEALAEILATVPASRGKGSDALLRNKEAALAWDRRFREETGPLSIARPEGTAAGIKDKYRRLFAPIKGWLAQAGGILAAELSLRYRAWRLDRGVQTYADQVETARSILDDPSMLERVRAEGWRVLLDEAQDTDPKQFAVLVEITRPPGAPPETWPSGAGEGPRPGHFCMVGDAQQGIYSARADIRNFQRHVAAFETGNGGEKLTFGVTFRAPRRAVRVLNGTLPAAFGPGREHNMGLPPEEGAPAPCLQVPYEALVPGPGNLEGAAWLLPIPAFAAPGRRGAADRKLSHEAREISARLRAGGPGSVGATRWGDVCILAPRTAWLPLIRDELEAAGIKTALQMRRNRNGDNPVYAWVCGLLAVVCDPQNTFEWVGVLREVFAISDAHIAQALAGEGGFRWDDPAGWPGQVAEAVSVLAPFVDRADAEGEPLERFACELTEACGLGAKARWVDPEGGLADELARLLARAAELGLDGAGPRGWLRDLLGSIDEFRAYGRPAGDAVNLMTSHSAKGLEWPVVIPVGLWRSIGSREPVGLRMVAGRDGSPRIVFDNEGVAADTRESLERERLRELVRLLYVTLTRPLGALVIPWSTEPFENHSFADLWGLDPSLLDPIPPAAAAAPAPPRTETPAAPVGPAFTSGLSAPVRPFPRRILPHELAVLPDFSRAVRHEASADEPVPARTVVDPLEYGVWWHETLERMPWEGDLARVDSHGAASRAKAGELGFEARASEEWDRLLGSEPWRVMRETRWTRLAEAGIFSPLGPDGWIDGVIDLVLHDPAAGQLWIVDWKTNRRREGEGDEALLARLADEYAMQLRAYGSCAAGFFPGCAVSLWVYSTVAGTWSAVAVQG